MSDEKLFQKFPQSEGSRAKIFFGKFKPNDFVTVKLEDLAEEDRTPMGVAEAIIKASEKCQKPVNLIEPKDWSPIDENYALIFQALRNKGYGALYGYRISGKNRSYWLEQETQTITQ